MLVRRTYLYHGYIARKGSASVKFLSFAEEYRNIVCVSCLYALTYIASYKEGLMKEYSVELFVSIRCISFCMQMMYAYITKLAGFAPAAKSLNEYLRCTCHTAEMYMVA